MNLLFDTHAHYDDPQFDEDRDALLASLPENGVGLVLIPGCDLATSRKALALAEQYPFVYAAVGCHPEDCASFRDEDIAEYREMAKHPKVVAIGEIGLDYYWEQNPTREVQMHALREQLKLALELDLPVIIHDRDAHADCYDLVREFKGLRGVFHCYSSSFEFAKPLLKMGWYLGFDGPLTFKNARRSVEVAEQVPLDRVLLETDSPTLAPEPMRGTRNDSTKLHFVAEKFAALRNMDVDEVIRITNENGRRLFGIAE